MTGIMAAQLLAHHDKAQSQLDADPELIRGMLLQDLLRRLASILGSSTGTADSYGLSRQLYFIETFLSHNWSTPRLQKLLVLVCHYNLLPAYVVTLVVSAVLFALMTLELLPNVTIAGNVKFVGPVKDPGKSFTSGAFCLPLGTLVFFVTLFSFHEATRFCCPSRNHTIFLDKSCIHQSDPELKKKGIQSLAAFLNHSGEMLVVFTDTYMQKLWTVYEVATWLILQRGDKMVVRPTCVPRMLLASIAVLSLRELLWLLKAIVGDNEPMRMTGLVSSTLFELPAFTAIARLIASCARERDNISEHLVHFKFSNAKCFCEDDRKVVQENIVTFVKFSGTCAADASDDEAVKAFEELARRVVPKAMDAAFGRVGLPYTYMLASILPRLLVHFDRAVGYFADSVPAYEVFWKVINSLFEVFVLCPLVDACIFLCMRCKLLRTWCGCVFMGASLYLGIVGGIVIFNALTSMAIDSPVWLAVHLPLRALLGALVFLLYRPVRAPPVQETR